MNRALFVFEGIGIEIIPRLPAP